MKVYYHANCADGFCAAMLFWYLFPKREYIPVQYGDPCPGEGDAIIVDFSWPERDLDNWDGNILVMDHHATSRFLKDKEYAIWDDTRSGAKIVFDYLADEYPPQLQRKLQKFVEYIQDRDLWKWELPRSREFSAGLKLYPMDFDVWNMLDINRLIDSGSIVLKYQEQYIERKVKHASWWIFTDNSGRQHRLFGVNNTECISEVAGQCSRDGLPGVSFFINDDMEVIVSLRGPNSRVIAEQFGGGGHNNAAGFKTNIHAFTPDRTGN